MSGVIIAKTNLRVESCERNASTASGRGEKKEREKDVREDLHDVHSRGADYWESGLVPHCISHISLPHQSPVVARNFHLTATTSDALESKVARILHFRDNQSKCYIYTVLLAITY